MLAWGKNFMPLTDFFLNNIPGYNKFRAVSMTLVMANLAIPLCLLFWVYKLLLVIDLEIRNK
jgi:ABC-type sulfate transport system permease subunit